MPSLLKCVLKGTLSLGLIYFHAEAQEQFRADASVGVNVEAPSAEIVPPSPPPVAPQRKDQPVPSSPPPHLEKPSVVVKATPPPLPNRLPVVTADVKKNTPRILPLVTFFDSVQGEVYNWWAENQSTASMSKVSQKLMLELVGLKNKNWRYGIPADSVKNFSEEYKKTALSVDEMRELAKATNAQMILYGDLVFTKSPVFEGGTRLKVRLKTIKTASGEVIAEVLRISDLQKWEYEKLLFSGGFSAQDAFNELHEQMQDKKEIRPNYVRLMISGRLSYLQLESIKQKIQKNIKGVKSIRPGAYENDQVALWIDYQGRGTQEFSRALSQVQFNSFLTQVVSTDAEQVLFDVKATRQ